MLRVTVSDFRRLYFVKETERSENYVLDNYGLQNLLIKIDHKIRDKFLQNFWATNNCLMRWDTSGAFKPDPTKINCIRSVQGNDSD